MLIKLKKWGLQAAGPKNTKLVVYVVTPTATSLPLLSVATTQHSFSITSILITDLIICHHLLLVLTG